VPIDDFEQRRVALDAEAQLLIAVEMARPGRR